MLPSTSTRTISSTSKTSSTFSSSMDLLRVVCIRATDLLLISKVIITIINTTDMVRDREAGAVESTQMAAIKGNLGKYTGSERYRTGSVGWDTLGIFEFGLFGDRNDFAWIL